MRALTLRSDRGGILVLTGIAAIALIATSALVIDMGHNHTEARRLQSAADAAALAAAHAYARGTPGCDAVAADFLTRNIADATLTSCEPHGDTTNGTYGWVVVDVALTVDQFLAGAIGITTVDLERQSVAIFGMPSTTYGTGARPMGLCLEGLLNTAEFVDWQATGPTTESDPIRITYDKDHPDDCGNTTGTWGFIDFDAGANSNQDTVDWIEFGYPDPVTTGWYEADTGAFGGSHKSALQALVDSGEQFWLPVFTEAGGNGANAQVHITDFLAVRLVGFTTTGSQANRYLEFVIDPLGLDAACCAGLVVGGFDTGSRQTGLFALDANGEPLGAPS